MENLFVFRKVTPFTALLQKNNIFILAFTRLEMFIFHCSFKVFICHGFRFVGTRKTRRNDCHPLRTNSFNFLKRVNWVSRPFHKCDEPSFFLSVENLGTRTNYGHFCGNNGTLLGRTPSYPLVRENLN